MTKILATAVHLTDDAGVVHSYLPGQRPPKWARSLITNPKAWAESDDDAPDTTAADDAAAEQAEAEEAARAAADAASAAAQAEADAEAERERAAEAARAAAVETAGTADAAATVADVPIPAGNASTQKWAEYASAKGFDVDPDVTRSDIIATLKANNVPTER